MQIISVHYPALQHNKRKTTYIQNVPPCPHVKQDIEDAAVIFINNCTLFINYIHIQSTITCADPEGGCGEQGVWTHPGKSQSYRKKGSLAILVRIPWKVTKLPSQHSMFGHYRPISETPFKWRFAEGPIMARY